MAVDTSVPTMKIPETGTDKDFPKDAVKRFDQDMVLLDVRDSKGHILWMNRANRSSDSKPKATIPNPKSREGQVITIILPQAAQEAISVVLSQATQISIEEDNLRLKDHYRGFLSGAYTVMGILMGALSIDTYFLKEGERSKDDDAKSNSS